TARQQWAIDLVQPLVDAKLLHMMDNVELQDTLHFDRDARERRVNVGKKLMDSVHAAIDDMRRQEESLRTQREHEFEQATIRLTWSFVLAGLIVVAVVGSFYHATERSHRQ